MDKGIWVVLCFAVLIGIFGYLYYEVEYPKVALIKIEGTIDENTYEDFMKAVSKANSSVEGFIIEINSPGGYVVPTERIARKIKSIDKPTVCLVDDTAASGAYWIASACDYIIADNYSIVGSIGATASYLEFSDLMKKYGINYVRIVSGEEKDIGSSYRKPTKEEIEFMKNITLEIKKEFVSQVAENRNLSYDYVDNLSDGRFFLGKEAINYHLVDEIGDFDTAKEYMKVRLNATDLRVIEYGVNPLKELFLRELSSEIVSKLFEANNKIKIIT